MNEFGRYLTAGLLMLTIDAVVFAACIVWTLLYRHEVR